MSIFTVGHSTFSKEDFLRLTGKNYTTLIDTRSHPGSKWPQYNIEELRQWIPDSGLGFEWWKELGGWHEEHAPLQDEMREHGVEIGSYLGRKFPKQRIAAQETPSDRPSWTNTGLRDYSYFQSTPGFLKAADDLIERGQNEHVAIMCCECQWWRCHRSMIADYLAFRNVECFHLMPRMRQKNLVKYVAEAKIIPHSSVLDNRLERYDQYVLDAWESHRPSVNPGIVQDCSQSAYSSQPVGCSCPGTQY